MSEIPVPDNLPARLREDLDGLWINHPSRVGSKAAPFSLFYAAYCAGFREGANNLALVIETNITQGFGTTEISNMLGELNQSEETAT